MFEPIPRGWWWGWRSASCPVQGHASSVIVLAFPYIFTYRSTQSGVILAPFNDMYTVKFELAVFDNYD